MKKAGARIFTADGSPATWCMFCGAKVGQVSERTGEKTTAVYYCPTCVKNYCDQCSYSELMDGKPTQLCLRCDTKLEAVV